MASLLSSLGTDSKQAEAATLLAREVAGIVGKEHLEPILQRQNAQTEERVREMLEHFHRVMLQEMTALVSSNSPGRPGPNHAPGRPAASSFHKPFQAQTLFPGSRSPILASSPEPNEKPDESRGLAEGEDEEMRAIREEEQKQEEAHKKDVKRRERLMEKLSADEIYGTSTNSAAIVAGRKNARPDGSNANGPHQEMTFLMTMVQKILIRPGSAFRFSWDTVRPLPSVAHILLNLVAPDF